MTRFSATLALLIGLSPDADNFNILRPHPSGDGTRQSRDNFRRVGALEYQMPRTLDITGQTFGRLTAISFSHLNNAGGRVWKCLCSCSKETFVSASELKQGHTKSCGCFKTDSQSVRMTIHGGTGTPEYRSWKAMKRRVFNTHTTDYPHYGGRGITVCDRWKDSFENFLADMGPKPTPKHTIERNNTNGNYEPGNCRWATQQEQVLNSSHNRMIEFRGVTKAASLWAKDFGLTKGAFYHRLNGGMTVEAALTTPPRYKKKVVAHP